MIDTSCAPNLGPISTRICFPTETCREPPLAIRQFTLAPRATRLPRDPSMLPSISFGTRVWVLAVFGGRALKGNEKTRPNRNGRGSPKLRLRAIQSPTLEWRPVYEVRSVPVNLFDKTEKSVPISAVSLVRNEDNGGADVTVGERSPLCKPPFYRVFLFAT